MLQSVRDNMKGTMVVVIVVLFIVPMVLSGIGGSFLGSVAGTDAASVNGETITRAELRREVFMQKQRMLSQGNVDPTSDRLKDENLQQPVLEQLTRRTALVVSASDAGMAAPDELVAKEIAKTEEFFTDGKFDQDKFRSLIANVGYTPATYQKAIARELVLDQKGNGLRQTSFITDSEVEQLVALLYQKRSFFTVEIPKADLEKDIVVDQQEIAAHYEANQNDFKEPESVSVKYIELSVDALMEGVEVAPEDVKAVFEKELSSVNYSPEFEIAHILIEDGDSAEEKINTVKTQLAEGAAFDELAKSYSDDAGSKDEGGVLGVLSDGFPEEFSVAVAPMKEGEISSAVKTDSGTHFIKVLKKTVPEPPTFDSRKLALENQLKRVQAEDIYVESLELLGDLTYSANDLNAAAEELNIVVQDSASFNRFSGEGIATDTKVREAAFEDDVLNQGHNSAVLELSNQRALVLRKLNHEPEHVKDLAEVQADIEKTLVAEKLRTLLAEKAQNFIDGADTVELAEKTSKELGYDYARHDDAKRTDPVASFTAREKAFILPAPEENSIEFSSDSDEKGNYVIVGLLSVKKGIADGVEKAQLQALKFQSVNQLYTSEMASYQKQITDSADVKVF